VEAYDEEGNEVLGSTMGNYLPDGVLDSQGGPYAKS